MTLSELKKGQYARVSHMNVNGNMRRRLQDIGLVKGASVGRVGVSPLGDPSAYLIKGAMIAIRNKEAEQICVDLSM